MRRSLTVILLQLPLCLMVQLDVLDDVHSMYHGIEATETELQLAAILGPDGVAILLIVAMVELFLLISFTCCWCCKCCCCSYLKHRPAAPPQVTVLPQQQIGMVPTGVGYPTTPYNPTPAPPYNPTQYASEELPDYSNYKMDAPLLDNME